MSTVRSGSATVAQKDVPNRYGMATTQSYSADAAMMPGAQAELAIHVTWSA